VDRFEVGPDLYVMVLPIAELKEQDLNAQVMSPTQMARLAENIRHRGQVESLPYCHWPNEVGPISIISGHHRVRAARQAGQVTIPALVDVRPMTRSEITAKQIAHNTLHGDQDEVLLRQLLALITHVDDLLATGLPEEYLPTLEGTSPAIQVPYAEFDWRLVTLTFLPKQMREFDAVVSQIEASDMVGAAPLDYFPEFAQAVHKYGRLKDVRSIGTTISLLIKAAHAEIERMEKEAAIRAELMVEREASGG
jgi:ParB-like nuclease domain